MREPEDAFLQAAKGTLDEGAERLDPGTAALLAQARRIALAHLDGLPRRPWLLRPWPAGAYAAVVAAVLAFGLWLAVPRSAPEAVLDDLELLSAAEGIEFYENLDFYRWLAAERNGAG